jgi:hypothetical protein
MSIQFSILFGIFIALAIPLLVLSAPFHEAQEEMIENMNHEINRGEGSNHQSQQPIYSLIHDDETNDDDHFILKKAADFEQILKPCNRMPASGRGLEYADCVRNRMLLMGR